jgi:hypothetical protein
MLEIAVAHDTLEAMTEPARAGDAGATTPRRLCPACDYDLRGISSARCPECGLAIDGGPPLTIPWEHRRQMGYVRAFWRTVRLAMFHCKRLAQAVAAPVDERSAVRFRLIVSLIAAAPPAAILLGAFWHEGGTGFAAPPINTSWIGSSAAPMWWEWLMLWSAGATLAPILPIGMFFTIWLATGSARFWFRALAELAREKRPAALSHYACAPLACVPISAASTITWLALPGLQRNVLWVLFVVLGLIAVGSTLFCLIAWWLATLQLLSRTTLCGWGRLIAAGILLPIGWMISAIFGLGLWTCLAGLVWLAIDSLRK